MNPTPREAIEAIHAELAAVNGLPASQVLDYEPYAGGLNTPLAVTCATGGITPTEVLVTVRCYASTTIQDAPTAWDKLNDLTAAVEDLLGDWARSSWERPLVLEVDSIILSTDVSVPRIDF